MAASITGVAAMFWLSRPSPAPAPKLVPLTSYPGLEERPSLSPDGSRVAFCWKGDIYVKEVGSEAVLQITKDPAVDSWPAWSPDASQIAFVRRGEVFVVSPLGGGERKVAESAGRDTRRLGFSRPAKNVRHSPEHLQSHSCQRRETAPDIFERSDSRRPGYGHLTRRPYDRVLPGDGNAGMRTVCGARQRRRGPQIDQRSADDLWDGVDAGRTGNRIRFQPADLDSIVAGAGRTLQADGRV